MSIHRRNPKRDKNEPEIVRALRSVGAKVYTVSGADIPDLLVIYRSDIYLIEVKSDSGKLQDGQEKFFEDNRNVGNIGVAYTVDEALAIIGVE